MHIHTIFRAILTDDISLRSDYILINLKLRLSLIFENVIYKCETIIETNHFYRILFTWIRKVLMNVLLLHLS